MLDNLRVFVGGEGMEIPWPVMTKGRFYRRHNVDNKIYMYVGCFVEKYVDILGFDEVYNKIKYYFLCVNTGTVVRHWIYTMVATNAPGEEDPEVEKNQILSMIKNNIRDDLYIPIFWDRELKKERKNNADL